MTDNNEVAFCTLFTKLKRIYDYFKNRNNIELR